MSCTQIFINYFRKNNIINTIEFEVERKCIHNNSWEKTIEVKTEYDEKKFIHSTKRNRKNCKERERQRESKETEEKINKKQNKKMKIQKKKNTNCWSWPTFAADRQTTALFPFIKIKEKRKKKKNIFIYNIIFHHFMLLLSIFCILWTYKHTYSEHLHLLPPTSNWCCQYDLLRNWRKYKSKIKQQQERLK